MKQWSVQKIDVTKISCVVFFSCSYIESLLNPQRFIIETSIEQRYSKPTILNVQWHEAKPCGP